jgi:hypothetical protein
MVAATGGERLRTEGAVVNGEVPARAAPVTPAIEISRYLAGGRDTRRSLVRRFRVVHADTGGLIR